MNISESFRFLAEKYSKTQRVRGFFTFIIDRTSFGLSREKHPSIVNQIIKNVFLVLFGSKPCLESSKMN